MGLTVYRADPKRENRKILQKITKHKGKYYFMISTDFSIKILTDAFGCFLIVILVPELFKQLGDQNNTQKL